MQKKDKREREGEVKRERGNRDDKIKRKETLGRRISLAIVSLCLRFSFRDVYPYVDGAFICRFIGHVRNVINYQNATRNDRQIELVGDVYLVFWRAK